MDALPVRVSETQRAVEYRPDPKRLARAFRECREAYRLDYACAHGFCGHRSGDPACRIIENAAGREVLT